MFAWRKPRVRPPAPAPSASVVLVLCGPIIGKVTETSAKILLEIDEDADLVCVASPKSGGAPVKVRQRFSSCTPSVFELQGLAPEMSYDITFEGIDAVSASRLTERGCVVRTLPQGNQLKQLRFIVVSCDYPSRLQRGEKNPWTNVAKLCKSGNCDVMLHLGDQVYTWDNGRMLAACRILEDLKYGTVSDAAKLKLHRLAARKLKDSYVNTFSQPDAAIAYAHSSHLMIWSDNDVTNDFTVLRKEDGSQEYDPSFLAVAMRVYRMYQRALWDPVGGAMGVEEFMRLPENKEWHFHRYGPCGVFFIDMRSNRILPNGKLKSGLPPLMADAQRDAIRDSFKSPGLSCMLLCAEIPFLGPDPVQVKEQATYLHFLKDHWAFNLDELTWVLDLCFSFKSSGDGHEVFLLGGDIHVGVDSTVTDSQTGLTIRQVTTGPITNSASSFHPALDGRLNDRYTYKHTPFPNQRNFCMIDLSFEGGAVVSKVELVCDSDM